MKVLTIEVTGDKGLIKINQPTYGAFDMKDSQSVFLSTEQIELFKTMLDKAYEEAQE